MSKFFPDGIALVWAFLKMYRKEVVAGIFLDFVIGILIIALPILLTQALAEVFHFNAIRGQIIGLRMLKGELLFALIAITVFVRFLADVWRNVRKGRLSELFAHQLRIWCFEQHLKIGTKQDIGRRLLRYSGDLGSAQRLLTHGILQGSADFLLLFLGVGCILWIDIHAGLWLLLTVGVFTAIAHFSHLKLRQTEQKRRKSKAKMLSSVNAALMQLQSIQVFNRTARTQRRFGKQSEQVLLNGIGYRRRAAISDALPALMAHGLILGSLLIGRQFNLDLPNLFLIILIVMSCRNAWIRWLRIGVIWQKGLLSLEKIQWLLKQENPDTPADKKISGHLLHIKDLALDFIGTQLEQTITLELGRGDKQFLHMPESSGKTLLTQTLAGLYEPQGGEILLDQTPLSNISLRRRRQLLSFVSEAFPLQGETILDAICNNPSDTERATRLFEAWQQTFPVLGTLSIQQKLNGRAGRLSSSQQVILQFLRVLIAPKPFIILDDPIKLTSPFLAQQLLHEVEKEAPNSGILILSSAIVSDPLHSTDKYQSIFFACFGNKKTAVRYT